MFDAEWGFSQAAQIAMRYMDYESVRRFNGLLTRDFDIRLDADHPAAPGDGWRPNDLGVARQAPRFTDYVEFDLAATTVKATCWAGLTCWPRKMTPWSL
ncbi:MAG: hypothetical protein ABSC06_06720 [Rhodopila sp.]